jgi:FtsP/CotA-like multicopper oxidase with cupredoxin domain
VPVDRRGFLRVAAALATAPLAPALPARAAAQRLFALEPRVARVPLVGEPHPDTEVWAYDGRVPGPELRVKQGDRLRVVVTNRLPEGTTVHWHGVRVPHPLLFAVKRNASCVVELVNDTAWDHPMHLHGHAFRVLAMNGTPTRHREWRDTVLLRARETAEIAFVADNPGDWMFHCHVLEHQAGGMMAVVRVG